MNEEQKRYSCHECPNGMQFDCEDYTPRQKGFLNKVCIWYQGIVSVEVRGRISLSKLEEKEDDLPK